MKSLEQCVRERLAEVMAKISKGKGIWPERDYVKDDDWAFLLGQRYILDKVLWDAERVHEEIL